MANDTQAVQPSAPPVNNSFWDEVEGKTPTKAPDTPSKVVPSAAASKPQAGVNNSFWDEVEGKTPMGPGSYQTKPGGPVRNVNPPADEDTSNWPTVQLQNNETHKVHPDDLSELMQRNPGAKVLEDTGVLAGVKRNTFGLVSGLYHAFTDPATDEEKQQLMSKVKAEKQWQKDHGYNPNDVDESLATNPSRATLALHRLIDAPADELSRKADKELEVGQKLWQNQSKWRGAGVYGSGLTDKALSATPVVGPAINSIAERIEKGDLSGGLTDLASIVALENAPKIAKAGGEVVGKVATKINPAELKPESLTKRPETPAPQHGAPVRVISPLDGPTVGKQLGGKDLSTEALKTLQGHVGDKIPVGSTAKNRLMTAVEPVSRTIAETSSKMNDAVKDAPRFTTSVMQDNMTFGGQGKLTDEIENLKKSLPPSVRGSLTDDIDAVMEDADKTLNSNDPAEILEYRRHLGRKIDWDRIEKNPTTPAEVQNAARAKVYRSIGDKIHSEIPATVELDKVLQPNIELRSHMASKLGDRVIDDPLAAKHEADSEFKKGQTTIENAKHNEQVARNWKIIKAAAIAAGAGAYGLDKLWKLFE